MSNGNGKQHARIFAEDLTSMLDADLSRCAMTVYLALRIRSVPGGDFWTDHGTLAEMLATTKNRFHPKSVSRAIAELCEANLIKRDGKTNRTRYLVMDCPWVIHEEQESARLARETPLFDGLA